MSDAVARQQPADARGWDFHALASSTSIEITFDAALPPGTKVWLTANWIGTRKQTGPMAAPVSIHLAGGGVASTNGMRMAA